MKAFSAPVDDILFCLEEVVQVGDLTDWDSELSAQVIDAFAKFAEQEIAPLNPHGDEAGCTLENGKVSMPSGFREMFQRFASDGWSGISMPEAYGGQGMGHVVASVVNEIHCGANHSHEMVTSLTQGACSVLMKFGTEAQRENYINKMAAGDILATMCLSEPGAGSDLGRIRCKAVETTGGWLIEGEKIFISGGGQNLTDGIMHLVLARTGGEGTRGLSLFACPSHMPDGSENAIKVARIEEKMGLHASPTCQMQFDGAWGEIIGQPGEGLKGMFAMMNFARLDVALQGAAHASRAYDIAHSYAVDRVQGRGDDGQPVTIDQHPIVQQMLDDIAGLAIGTRAMTFEIMKMLELGGKDRVVDFLTPVIKAFGSEAGINAASLAQDVLGGYGYLTEYYADQTYRDARICAIYEGTNAIHAMGLLKRQLADSVGKEGFEAFIAEIADATGEIAVADTLSVWRDTAAMIMERQYPADAAKDFMDLTSGLLFMAMWAKILVCADKAPNPEMYKRVAMRVISRTAVKAKCWATMIAA